jgi:hypothetical protein
MVLDDLADAIAALQAGIAKETEKDIALKSILEGHRHRHNQKFVSGMKLAAELEKEGFLDLERHSKPS